ncbi:hypothetical protein CcI49_14805 [Frankia sp. CcI49]|nr:hypothetical protein CcI49_14805 [Frankia sp. CcI49]
MRLFASDVRSFAENAEDDCVALRGRFNRLDWDDDQQRRFGEELTETITHLRNLIAEVDRLAPVLDGKASHLERYQGR